MKPLRLFRQALVVLSLFAIGFGAYLLVLSPVQHDRSQAVLYAQARQQLAKISMPTGGIIKAGEPVAVLEIPGLRLTQVVVEGTAGGQLASGPGHRRTTPLPGQPGTSVLMGRAETFGGPFRHITKLQGGDEINATTGQGRFTYRVDGIRRAGDPTPPPLPKGAGRMVLVSAEGADFTGPNQTVFVDATLLSDTVAPPSRRPKMQTPEEAPLASDSGALMDFVLSLQALVLAVGLFAWARNSWGRWETWLVGMPVVLAATWLVYKSGAVALLPNLL